MCEGFAGLATSDQLCSLREITGKSADDIFKTVKSPEPEGLLLDTLSLY